MLGYIFSVSSVWVDKLLIGISASINIAHAITSINYNIRHMRDIVSGIINRNFASVDDVNEIYSNLFNNGIPINVNATYIKTEPDSDDESEDDDSDDIDGDVDDSDHGDVDDSDHGDELANLSVLIPIKDETSHHDSDEYADLPELIPITDEVIDEYADLPELIPITDEVTQVADEPKNEPHVADNKVYIDDDIQDVTDQYLAEKEAEKEANKVIVDLTDDNKNTSSDTDKNTSEFI